MFAALVRDREGLAPELTDVRRFTTTGRRRPASSCGGSADAIDTYAGARADQRGDRDEMLDALYLAWKEDTEAGRTSLMIAADLGTVSELNTRARADRIAAGEVDRARVGRWPAEGRPGWETRWSPARTTGVFAPAEAGSATATSGPSQPPTTMAP